MNQFRELCSTEMTATEGGLRFSGSANADANIFLKIFLGPLDLFLRLFVSV